MSEHLPEYELQGNEGDWEVWDTEGFSCVGVGETREQALSDAIDHFESALIDLRTMRDNVKQEEGP